MEITLDLIMKKVKRTSVFILLLLVMNFAGAMDSLLIINSSDKHYQDAVTGIIDYAENKYAIHESVLPENFDYKKIEPHLINLEKDLIKYKPKFVILISNKAAILYYRYQKDQIEKKAKPVPAIIISSIFTDQLVNKMNNTIAIRYETPIAISASNLRYYSMKPVKNIGVVHRKWMKGLIEDNKKWAEIEKINIISYEITQKEPTLQNIEYYFKKLMEDNIDAVWLLSDNILINKNTMPVIKPIFDKIKKPVIVNTDELVKKDADIGTFSAVPDQYGLGVQAIQTINSIFTSQQKTNDTIENILVRYNKIIEPRSTVQTLNMSLSKKKNLKYYAERTYEIENIIK
jgi:hypothetical protein